VSFWYAADGRLHTAWRFLLSVIVVFVCNIVALNIAGAAARTQRGFDLIYRPLALLLLLVGLSILLKGADQVENSPLAAMGLGRQGTWLRQATTGMLLGSAMVTFAVSAMAVFGDLSTTITLNRHAAVLFVAELVILTCGAMAEEVAFRGYPFQRLIEWLGAIPATVISCLLFGSVHLANPHASVFGFINTATIGALLALAYLRSRALWMPWGVHFGWNFTLGLVFGLPVSGLTQFAVVVHTTAHGPFWLTGGSYGIEASRVGTVAIILGCFALVWLVPASPAPAPQLVEAPGETEHAVESGMPPGSIQP
jgi:hypothetical protein